MLYPLSYGGQTTNYTSRRRLRTTCGAWVSRLGSQRSPRSHRNGLTKQGVSGRGSPFIGSSRGLTQTTVVHMIGPPFVGIWRMLGVACVWRFAGRTGDTKMFGRIN